MTRQELVADFERAREAIRQFDIAEAADDLARAEHECSCDPANQTYDPYCRVPDAVRRLEHAQAGRTVC